MCKTKLQTEIKRREKANTLSPFPVYDTEVINDLKILDKMKGNYDNEEVHFCNTCLSIALKTVEIPMEGESVVERKENGITYCVPCGNTDIDRAANIHVWEDLYAERYGEKFLKEN